MQKQAPTLGRLMAMVLFALSCFGLLLFLWLSFGGAVPLKPKGYQFRATFPEAAMLAHESDVRIAGVLVGRVRDIERAPQGNLTLATIELQRRYAPIASDARAVLRQKGILGETYVELTTGSRTAPRVPDGGLLPRRNVAETVELDEILDTLDPYTRQAFRTWQRTAGAAIDGRGQDVNDALGSLPEFVDSGGDLLTVLDEQRGALQALVRNTGAVFGAVTEREDQLRALIRNSNTVFRSIDREREAFADTWRTFPTFLDESRATFARLERFARDTRPLVRDLRPAFDDLGPTLEAVRDFSPDLRRFFVNFGPLIEASRRSLPATRQIFEGLRPLLGQLGPWLGELNPTLDWIGQHQHTLVDMLANLGGATAARTGSDDPRATGHYLRQFGPTGAETVAVFPTRLAGNRGNAYLHPLELTGPRQAQRGILPAFDCENAGGERDADPDGASGQPACRVQPPYRFNGQLQRFPHIEREDYSRPGSENRPLRP